MLAKDTSPLVGARFGVPSTDILTFMIGNESDILFSFI
jgi:hypothetical protein